MVASAWARGQPEQPRADPGLLEISPLFAGFLKKLCPVAVACSDCSCTLVRRMPAEQRESSTNDKRLSDADDAAG